MFSGLIARAVRPVGTAAAVLVASAGLVACGGGSGTGAEPAGPGGTDAISIALPGGANVSHIPILVAEGTGLFAKNGVSVEQKDFATGGEALAALLGGSVDVANVGGLDLLRSAEKDAGVVGFYSPFLSASSAFIGAKRLEGERGTDLAKFGDASWGYAKEGSTAMYYMQTAAQGAGLDWSKLNRAAVGSQSAMLAAMQAGRLDIISADSTTSAKAVQQGIGYLVLNTSDPAATEKYWPQQMGSVLVTSKTFAEEKPEVLQKFVNGLIDGQKSMQQSAKDPAALLAKLPDAKRTDFGPSWAQQWQIMSPGYVGSDGTIPAAVLQNTIDWATRVGALPADTKLPDTATYLDNSYVEKAYQTLGRSPAQ